MKSLSREVAFVLGSAAVAGMVMPQMAAGAVSAKSAKRPNIIVILADDLGYEGLGSYGSAVYKTPTLDKLAAEGMRFLHCYSQPLCTPSRVQMMTGIYNVRNYTAFGELKEGEVTFGNLLKDVGYVTGIFGKWQLGSDKDSPGRFGFDQYVLWQHLRRPPRYANPGLDFQGVPKNFKNGEYGPDLINAEVLKFVEKNKDKPFFLYYPMILTHDPFQPTPDSKDWDPKAMGEGVGKDPKHFADMVAYMDKLVGRLLAKLNELQLQDNTMVLFVGDNGTSPAITTLMQDGSQVKGGKGQGTDGGTRVPLLVRYPGVAKTGQVTDTLVDFTDFLPTVCEVAGVPVPAALKIDGRSFLPQIKGEKGNPREWVYCWFSRGGGKTAKVEFARNQRYKLYAAGNFYNVSKEGEGRPIKLATLDGEAKDAYELLKKAMDQFKNARLDDVAALGKNGGTE